MVKGPSGRELAESIHTAFESFSKEDRSFNCRCCGKHFVPSPGQWIFHNLCDECFTEFDNQKMRGRFRFIGLIEGVEEPSTESCEEWLKWKKGKDR